MSNKIKKVLIADSNEIDRSVLSKRLEVFGYDVNVAKAGNELKTKINNDYNLILISLSINEIDVNTYLKSP